MGVFAQPLEYAVPRIFGCSLANTWDANGSQWAVSSARKVQPCSVKPAAIASVRARPRGPSAPGRVRARRGHGCRKLRGGRATW